MAKTFFENFRQAGKIYPGTTFGTDSDGNIRMANGNIRNVNLPDAIGNYNVAAYNDRIAIPFNFRTVSDDGNGKKKASLRSGILYVPYYEGGKIDRDGIVDTDDIEIYGAELGNQSLTREGFQKLFNDRDNTNFKFDVYTGANAKASSENRNTQNKDYNVREFQAQNGDFMTNLRRWLWGA